MKDTRNVRKREVRSKVTPEPRNPVAKAKELKRLRVLNSQIEDYEKPRTRADCRNSPRPCPYVSCEHHLYLEVRRNGSIVMVFPDLEPHEMQTPSCALDVADSGGATLNEVGEYLNLTRERARQLEASALDKLRREETEWEY